ncbi:MAG TPA: glycosyltransferase [Gaiellaceae bacterium]|nr:glycosyltransferase [Gaiellaceae bacterium]
MAWPKRLLIASQPLDAGVPRQVLELVEALDPERYRFDVACPRESLLWTALAARRDVSLHPIAPDREPGPADARTFARLLTLVARADVVHAHSAKAGFLARLAAAARGRAGRCVFSPHGWSFWAADGARSGVYRTLERLAAPWCARIAVVSEHERAAGLAAGIGTPPQYAVVPNGIAVERFAAAPDPVAGRLLMIGRLARPKRPDLVVRAVDELRRRFPEVHLLLAGDGPLRPDVERLLHRLGLGGHVSLLGSREDVPELVRTAACIVLASDYEGCPVSIIEGMAGGVPVVATRVGGVPELVGAATGVLVEPGSHELLAAALGRLLERPELGRELGEAGRTVARRRFTRERMAAGLAALYEEAAA